MRNIQQICFLDASVAGRGSTCFELFATAPQPKSHSQPECDVTSIELKPYAFVNEQMMAQI